MKKITTCLTLLCLLAGSSAFAAQPATGKAAAASKKAASDCFAWGVALGSIVVVGVVVGVAAAAASSDPTTFSH
jgi:hypothetical protein